MICSMLLVSVLACIIAALRETVEAESLDCFTMALILSRNCDLYRPGAYMGAGQPKISGAWKDKK